MTEVIAHYKRWKIWACLGLMASIIVSIPIVSILAFGPGDGTRQYHFAERSMAVFAWFLEIPLIREFVGIFRQLVFHGGRMIWIENRDVVWRYPGAFTIPGADIVKVFGGFGGNYGQLDTITFRLRDGSEKVIKTIALDESCDEVISRLRNALNL
jgi:hypothetical protein